MECLREMPRTASVIVLEQDFTPYRTPLSLQLLCFLSSVLYGRVWRFTFAQLVRMTWELRDIVYNPVWMISTVILGLVVRSQRRGSWDPRACKVELKGKTAIVTGANTGELLPFILPSAVIINCMQHWKTLHCAPWLYQFVTDWMMFPTSLNIICI